jgi:hypothetical protein
MSPISPTHNPLHRFTLDLQQQSPILNPVITYDDIYNKYPTLGSPAFTTINPLHSNHPIQSIQPNQSNEDDEPMPINQLLIDNMNNELFTDISPYMRYVLQRILSRHERFQPGSITQQCQICSQLFTRLAHHYNTSFESKISCKHISYLRHYMLSKLNIPSINLHIDLPPLHIIHQILIHLHE